jgi:hypothetical protein
MAWTSPTKKLPHFHRMNAVTRYLCDSPGAVQEKKEDHGMTGFDFHRALLVQMDIFAPLYVTATHPLRDALASGRVRESAPVLVAEHRQATMVLLRRQLTYHHVAQGETGGEPWMVSY